MQTDARCLDDNRAKELQIEFAASKRFKVGGLGGRCEGNGHRSRDTERERRGSFVWVALQRCSLSRSRRVPATPSLHFHLATMLLDSCAQCKTFRALQTRDARLIIPSVVHPCLLCANLITGRMVWDTWVHITPQQLSLHTPEQSTEAIEIPCAPLPPEMCAPARASSRVRQRQTRSKATPSTPEVLTPRANANLEWRPSRTSLHREDVVAPARAIHGITSGVYPAWYLFEIRIACACVWHSWRMAMCIPSASYRHAATARIS